MNLSNFNPFNKNKNEVPKQEASLSVPGIEGDLYSDENAIKLQERFGTIDIHKIEKILAEQEQSGEITRIPQEEPAEEYEEAA